MAAEIEKRIGRNGKVSWVTVVSLPRDKETGKRKQIHVTRATKREVEAERARLLAEYAAGTLAITGSENKKQTIEEYLTEWLRQASANLRPASVGRYGEIIRLHITPELGKSQLTKLAPQQVSRFYTKLLEGGMSRATIANVHTVLHRALDQAVKWGIVTHNVTDRVTKPSKGKPEHRAMWNDEQVRLFLAAADKDEFAILWWVAVYSGMRRGELLGLKWEDVDFDGGSVSVKRTYSRGAANKFELGKPKTQTGRRLVTLPSQVMARLKAHHLRQMDVRMEAGEYYQDQGFVFADPIGKPIHPNTLVHHYHRIIASAGLPRLRIHDLRHGHASLLMGEGLSAKIVAERLGHSNTRITLDLYSHVSPGMQQQVSDLLERRINGK
jgi:integrase